MYRQEMLPRWRGFNLNGRHRENGHFLESDFRLMAELEFDYVRLPLCYWDWIDHRDPFCIDESKIAFVDEAVSWGERYGIHVSLNFHRAPGYCVSDMELEPFRLFEDRNALSCFMEHWALFAKRYKGQSSRFLSFNLLNEPSWVASREHAVVMRDTVRRIRSIDPNRLIMLDGLNTGNDFPTDLIDLASQNVAFCTRGFVPLGVSHYEAPWDQHDRFETECPTWPNGRNRNPATGFYDGLWSRNRLDGKYRVWAAIAQAGKAGIFCGACGCYNRTPHATALAWLEDLLDILMSMNIGYALADFRGPFGILDSGRRDADYEDWHGYRLDRKMLAILQQH